MFKIRRHLILMLQMLFLLCLCSSPITFAQSKEGKDSNNITIFAKEGRKPVLAITPREIDMGVIAPGEIVSGTFTLKNMGFGIMGWSTYGPEGWKAVDNQVLSSVVEDDADYLRVEVRVMPSEQSEKDAKIKATSFSVEIKLEAENRRITCQRELAVGDYRKAIKIASIGGLRTVFVTFKIVADKELAQIVMNPKRMDMGQAVAGKTVSKKIRLTNKGKETLRWNVVSRKSKKDDSSADFLKKGRYVSFVNEEKRGAGAYSPPAQISDSMDVVGKWKETDGYPSSAGENNTIKLRFSGSGISLYFTTYPVNGNLTIYLNDRLVSEHDWFADQKENNELLIAENLIDGEHVLTLINKEGRLEIEGVKILGKEVIRLPAGLMSIFPSSGSTTIETEFINVSINSSQLLPGLYGDLITFSSNGGDGAVEVFVEVISDKLLKSVDVYRYSRGFDYLFTSDPQTENKKISQHSYVKEGIAFRLFAPDTPGTANFFRWYSQQKKSHFYHHDPKGGGKELQGYVLEGSIGNIATSKMANTRELYRWFNQNTGYYFFTTDPKGEGMAKRKYRFDGIAGYVK